MDNIKWTIKAICGQLNLSIEALANKAGINYNHLKMVSSGYVKMTGEDLVKLHNATGIPMENIETEYKR